MPLLFALVLLLAASLAHATVYKCAAELGVLYQDIPCAGGKELRNLDADPPNLSVVPGAQVSLGKAATAPQSMSTALAHDRRGARAAP